MIVMFRTGMRFFIGHVYVFSQASFIQFSFSAPSESSASSIFREDDFASEVADTFFAAIFFNCFFLIFFFFSNAISLHERLCFSLRLVCM